ncbi:MAG: carboxypeptidase regulatory-like domain-containing protein [Deltaproteobacteria bacterium]|nr:carboxypeptidase regulatory-like domain-containing protein [Deltaproteobacteria bacterium]
MPVTTQPPRRLRYVLAAAAAALALGWWWSRSSDEPTSPDAAGARGRDRDGGDRVATALDRMRDARHRIGPRGMPKPSMRGDLAHVTGKVIDHTAEKPVPNVEVVFAGPDGEASATTGADGSYAIDVAPAAYRAYVRGDGVISVGFAGPERLPGPPVASRAGAPDDTLAPTIAIARDQDHVDLEVEEGGVVNGRVFDRAGHPVVGAIVRARGNERPVLGTDVAETGLDGTFHLELPVGGWSLEATHADYAGIAPGEGEPWVSVSPAQVASIDLTMVAGCIVRGHVIAADGGPAADGAVEVGQGDNGFAPAGQIDADGEFRWSTLETGPVLLRAWPWKSPPSVAQTFTCSEGARFDAEFRLSTANPDLDGSIATADGRPAPGAFIDVWALTPGGMSQQERADADGNWAVYTLPAGDYLVTATVDGAGQVQRRITVPAHGVALGLSGTGTVVGTTKGLDEGMVALMFGACSTGDVDVPNMTAAATRLAPVHGGHFRIDGVPACQLDIAARAGSQTEVQSVTVTKDREASVSFDLTPPHEVAIHGHVYRADGKPAVGARINTMRDGDDEIGGVTTGSDGSYQVTTSTGDSIIASVEAEVGGVTVPRDAQNGATLDIHLSRDDYEGEIQEPGDEGVIEEHTVEASAGTGDVGVADPGAPDVGANEPGDIDIN